MPSALLDNNSIRATGLPSSIHAALMGLETRFAVGVPNVMEHSIDMGERILT